MIDLGRWAVIDIETSGIDPSYDEIIDLGYLQFEGTRLVRKYSSLVKGQLLQVSVPVGTQIATLIKSLGGLKT